jgi:hypothetical protein
MQKTLDKTKLIGIIETCAAFSPEPIRSVADRVIQEFVVDCPVVTTTDAAVLFLRSTINSFRFMISPEQFERLERAEIYVTPAPICNAYADPVDQLIVIFDGLLEAIAFRLETSLLIAEVGKRLGKLTGEDKISEQDFKVYALRATLMPIHFMRSGKHLPRFIDKLSAELQKDAYGGFSGMLLFILFHELGHLVLNHGAMIRSSRLELMPTLACSEMINTFKLYEFEADEYAYNAVLPEARGAFIVNVWTALKTFSEFESMSGIDEKMHPFTINRISRLNGLNKVLDDPIIGAHARKIFEADFRLMEMRLAGRDPRELAIPEEVLRKIYAESFNKVIDEESKCREAVEILLKAYQATE